MITAAMKTPLRAILSASVVAMVMLPVGSFLCVSRDAHVEFLVAGCIPTPIDLPGHADEGLPDPPVHGRDHHDADGCHDLRVGPLQSFEREAEATLPSPGLQLCFVPTPVISFHGATTPPPVVTPYEANGPPESMRPERVPLRI